MGATGERIVEDPHVARVRSGRDDRAHRVGHRSQMDRNRRRLRDHLAVGIEDRGAAVTAFGDVGREGAAHERGLHLLGDCTACALAMTCRVIGSMLPPRRRAGCRGCRPRRRGWSSRAGPTRSRPPSAITAGPGDRRARGARIDRRGIARQLRGDPHRDDLDRCVRVRVAVPDRVGVPEPVGQDPSVVATGPRYRQRMCLADEAAVRGDLDVGTGQGARGPVDQWR